MVEFSNVGGTAEFVDRGDEDVVTEDAAGGVVTGATTATLGAGASAGDIDVSGETFMDA